MISPDAILRDASGDGVQAEGGQLAYKTDSGKYKVQLVPASGYFTQLTTDNYIEGLRPGLGSSEQQLLNAVDDR